MALLSSSSDMAELSSEGGSGTTDLDSRGPEEEEEVVKSNGTHKLVGQGRHSLRKYLPHTIYTFTMKPHYRAPDGSVTLVRVGKGAWYNAAFHLATTIATPAAFAPLPSAMAALGWPSGVVMLVASTLVSWYSSILVASLWEFDGKKHISYRDLMDAIFGRLGFWAVVFFQQVASLGNNIAIQIAGGISMKEIYRVYRTDNAFNLQEFIVLFGVVELLLSQLPDIHSLRFVNLVCTCCTVGFATVAVAMSIHDGKMLDRSTVEYGLHGSRSSQLFGIASALGTVTFSFGDAMLPEIQATIREPTKMNMYKGISLAYSVIMVSYWSVAFVGYWAFGSNVQPYILSSFTTPTWPLIMANVFAIVQTLGCYQIYCRPTYDYFLCQVMDLKQGPYAVRNGLGRLLVTTVYIVLVTLISAAMPFFGDFVALCGALGFTPLDFIIPALAFLVVRKPKNLSTLVSNVGIAVIYVAVAILGSVGAIRFIVKDVQTYKFFSNL